MRVSVIIPNYNYAEFLPLAIGSLLNQADKVDEIIVVDDGSTDNSREVLEAYSDKIIAIFKPNGGQASAFSTGFARATGDIVCLLDSDDVFFPDKVKILKDIYKSHPNAGWIFHALEHIVPDEAKKKTYPRFNNINSVSIDVRKKMAMGKGPYIAPATSGLTFRRDFIAPIFPLPSAESIYISDHYIKFYAVAHGPGVDIPETLGGQIIHGENLFTGNQTSATRAKIFMNTAYSLRQNFPVMRVFSNNLMAEGILNAQKSGVMPKMQNLANDYWKDLSGGEKLYLWAKMAVKRLISGCAAFCATGKPKK